MRHVGEAGRRDGRRGRGQGGGGELVGEGLGVGDFRQRIGVGDCSIRRSTFRKGVGVVRLGDGDRRGESAMVGEGAR